MLIAAFQTEMLASEILAEAFVVVVPEALDQVSVIRVLLVPEARDKVSLQIQAKFASHVLMVQIDKLAPINRIP